MNNSNNISYIEEKFVFEIYDSFSYDKKLETKSLYRLVFDKDEKEFVDFYYAKRIKNNIIFVLRTKNDNNIVSMIHLNPYYFNIDGKNQNILSYYLVAVATMGKYRHKGLMSYLLNEVFKYMSKKSIPFIFLMPENKNIYEQFGFFEVDKFYFYDDKQYKKYLTVAIDEEKKSFLEIEKDYYDDNFTNQIMMMKIIDFDKMKNIYDIKNIPNDELQNIIKKKGFYFCFLV